jgi:hypothetical protein
MQPDQPTHPLHALTTYELRDYRRELEHSLKGVSANVPLGELLRQKLAAVMAEQESRTRLRQANGH